MPDLRHPLRSACAASIVVLLVIGGLIYNPWPGPGWLLVAASHAWLLGWVAVQHAGQSGRVASAPTAAQAGAAVQQADVLGRVASPPPKAAQVLATVGTVSFAIAHTVLGTAHAFALGWSLGLCAALVALQMLVVLE